MKKGTDAARRARRQERVTKLVWGLLFVVMGTLFMLHDLGKVNLGSTRMGNLAPEFAVDGKDDTRWSSNFDDRQWIAVDLGAPVPIERVVLKWEQAYGKNYDVQVSDDGQRWTTAREVRGGDGGVDEIDVGAPGRFVRVAGKSRATPWGYSLYELQVFGEEGALLSEGRPVTASSVEGWWGAGHPWPLYWPLLLVAAGLPLVLAPRDDANLVFGVFLTGAGAYWQLHMLDLVDWSFTQSAAVLLIVAGLLILLQSLRRDERQDPGDEGVETQESAQ